MLDFDKKNLTQCQQGQTLIETMVAIFMLTMGIGAALALAIYSLNASQNVNKQIIAVGLAREGIEAVKNMRDSNWLKDTLSTPATGNGCYDFQYNQAGHESCYRSWLGSTTSASLYCINPGSNASSCLGGLSSDTYRLEFDGSTSGFWKLQKEDSNNFGLNFSSSDKGKGFYYTDTGSTGVSCQSGTSGYCRTIVLTKLTAPAGVYDKDTGPMLEVDSEVWWSGRNCPLSTTFPTTGKCSVKMVIDLTNWKNY